MKQSTRFPVSEPSRPTLISSPEWPIISTSSEVRIYAAGFVPCFMVVSGNISAYSLDSIMRCTRRLNFEASVPE